MAKEGLSSSVEGYSGAELDRVRREKADQADVMGLFSLDVAATYEPVSAWEACQLARRVKENDDLEAKRRLVIANMPLAIDIAGKERSSLPFPDRVQSGFVGLLEGISSYNSSKGAFSTFATFWIRAGIQEGTEEASGVFRLPRYMYGVLKVVREICGEKGDEAVGDVVLAIKERMKEKFPRLEVRVDRENVALWLGILKGSVSYEALFTDKVGEEVAGDEVIPDFSATRFMEDGQEKEELIKADRYVEIKRKVKEIVNDGVVTPAQREELILRLGLDGIVGDDIGEEWSVRDLAEVARILGISKEAARSREKNAMRRISHSKSGERVKELFRLLDKKDSVITETD